MIKVRGQYKIIVTKVLGGWGYEVLYQDPAMFQWHEMFGSEEPHGSKEEALKAAERAIDNQDLKG
jgi:hypothetical protein